jgi:hypothetical protein
VRVTEGIHRNEGFRVLWIGQTSNSRSTLRLGSCDLPRDALGDNVRTASYRTWHYWQPSAVTRASAKAACCAPTSRVLVSLGACRHAWSGVPLALAVRTSCWHFCRYPDPYPSTTLGHPFCSLQAAGCRLQSSSSVTCCTELACNSLGS